jgi:acyloxyacyl hydrolase
MLSAGTAFFNSTANFPDISGPVNSSYSVFRQRNLCNHRDYQNIGVNGARVGSMNDTIVESMSRNQVLCVTGYFGLYSCAIFL